MNNTNVIFALSLTVLAGLATGIGGIAAFITERTNTRFLAGSLGFSAGVMIYISFVELLPYGDSLLRAGYGEDAGPWVTVAALLGGMVGVGLIDWLVPSAENPHEAALVEDLRGERKSHHLKRVGMLTALALAIHNVPEGLATFVSALGDRAVGVPIAVAIALHNIPEGLSVAIPIYFATGSRRKAVAYAFISGISEPVGAAIGYLILYPFLSDRVLGVVHAAVAGIMVFISLDQLVPNAKRYEEGHDSVYGLILGIGLMAITLLLL